MLVAIAGSARADYVMLPFRAVIAETTSIVDATVVEHGENGSIGIVVQQVLKGDSPPTTLGGAWRTCLGIDISEILKLDTRYVFLLYRTGLYEENSFYETEERAGVLFCKCWDGTTRRWMPILEFRRLVDEAQANP